MIRRACLNKISSQSESHDRSLPGERPGGHSCDSSVIFPIAIIEAVYVSMLFLKTVVS